MEMDIRWDEGFVSNIDLIDTQHRRIFRMLKIFMDEIDTVNRGLLIKRGMAIFDELTNSHFGTEESFMQQYSYPQYDLHRLQHRNYDKIIKYLKNQHDSAVRDDDFVKKMEIVLKRYWWNHIPEFDKPMNRFLRSQAGNS